MSTFKLTHGEYVKFVRTTATVWNNVPDQQKDSDTLYFVVNAERTAGDLYLGNTLISGVSSGFNLADLNDVLAYNNVDLANGSLIVWDSEDNVWKPVSLFEALSDVTDSFNVMTGATANTNGVRGLVPDPKAGDQNKFLAGNGTWVNPTALIQTVVKDVAQDWFGAEDWSQDTNSPTALIREIASDEVAKVVAGAPEAFDTLKEIATWIQNESSVADLSHLQSRVSTLETIVSTGTPPDDNGHPGVPSLVTQVNTLNVNFTSLDARVTNVEETLRWQDMSLEN